jgi:hypothetical protein
MHVIRLILAVVFVLMLTTFGHAQYLKHPHACPARQFCGCGASVRVFGHAIRSLYLAANWFKFPRAYAAPGMAAVRRHHVFVIERVYGDGTVLASDYNSGGHRSRLHRVSLSGYVVVDPHGWHGGRFAWNQDRP